MSWLVAPGSGHGWMDGIGQRQQWRVFFAPTQRSAGGKRKRTHLVSNDSDDANDEANKANERREQTQDILSSKRDSGRRKIPSISSTITAACDAPLSHFFPGRPPLPLVGAAAAVVVVVLLLLNCVTNNSYFPRTVLDRIDLVARLRLSVRRGRRSLFARRPLGWSCSTMFVCMHPPPLRPSVRRRARVNPFIDRDVVDCVDLPLPPSLPPSIPRLS